MMQANLPPPPIQDFSVMPSRLNTACIVIQIYGWFLMIVGVLLLLCFCGLGVAAAFSEDAGAALSLGMGVFSGSVFGGIGFIVIKTAAAIQGRKVWGKIFGIILAILSVGIFPIGTIAAIEIFFGLFSKESEGWFIY